MLNQLRGSGFRQSFGSMDGPETTRRVLRPAHRLHARSLIWTPRTGDASGKSCRLHPSFWNVIPIGFVFARKHSPSTMSRRSHWFLSPFHTRGLWSGVSGLVIHSASRCSHVRPNTHICLGLRRMLHEDPAQLIRIEATLAVASILGARKPGIPLSVSSRVVRHERVGSVCLMMVCGMTLGASAELREMSAGREKVVALLACAARCALMAGAGRTGAVGCPHRVAPRS